MTRLFLALLLSSTAALAEDPIVVFAIGPQGAGRRITYRDRLTPELAGYRSGVMGLGAASLELYPAANKGLPIVSNLGLVGSYARSLPQNTYSSDGSLALRTTWLSWDAGLQWRAEWLALSIRYGTLRNDFTGAQTSLPGVVLPSGVLQYWRPGVAVNFDLGPVNTELSGGYLAPVTQDALGSVFPRERCAGLDGGVSFRLDFGAIGIRISGRYTRFWYALHPLPRDPYVAGGALDESVTADLAMVIHG